MAEQDDLSVLASKPFDGRVSQLRELFDTNSAMTFLLGAGCSKCAGLPLTEELTTVVLSGEMLDEESKAILNAIQSEFRQGSKANIEDYLSELIDFSTIADRRAQRGSGEGTITLGRREYCPSKLSTAIEQIKLAVAKCIDKKFDIQTLETHRDFVTLIHQPVRVGRGPHERPASYVVLNYDTLIEDALALQKIPYSDGIDGGVTGWWSPESLDREGLAAQVLKLHGSVNWHEFPSDPLPRRIGP